MHKLGYDFLMLDIVFIKDIYLQLLGYFGRRDDVICSAKVPIAQGEEDRRDLRSANQRFAVAGGSGAGDEAASPASPTFRLHLAFTDHRDRFIVLFDNGIWYNTIGAIAMAAIQPFHSQF